MPAPHRRTHGEHGVSAIINFNRTHTLFRVFVYHALALNILFARVARAARTHGADAARNTNECFIPYNAAAQHKSNGPELMLAITGPCQDAAEN